MLRTAARALLVGAGYWVAGSLGLLLAIPPGYATAVWPPSGIALAGLLLGGLRLAPGIFVGSFLLNIRTGFSSSDLVTSLAVPIIIALGAALQATLGAWLIRTRGYRVNPLAGGTDVVPVLLLGGPVACLLNATIGVGSLYISGKVAADLVPFTWWTWWVGDSIGVLLFTPLVLVWAARPLRTWLRRQVYVTAPLALLFAGVVVMFVYIKDREQARIEAEFGARAEDIHQGLRVRLGATLDVLSSIEGFYASNHDVEPWQFEIFAQRLAHHLEGVSALSWNPVVPDGQRAAFEARVRRSGHPDYRITERAPDGSLRTAARRDQYVPVETIAPLPENDFALGFDTASEPVRRSAMEHARDTGAPEASGPVKLLQNGEPGVLVLLPVYRHGSQDYSAEARRLYLRGYAVAVFSLQGLIGDAPRRAQAAGLSLALFDDSPGEARVIYATPEVQARFQREFRFVFAGRPWRLVLGLPEGALVARRSWQVWFVLAGGLFLTGLLGLLLLLGVGRTAQIEALVTERTDELRRTTAQLVHSNRELEQFAYITSHDLKAPLRTIASFAQLLAKRHGDTLQGEGRDFLDFITSGVKQMQELIDDLLELSRVDARKLEVTSLSMRVAVDRACNALAADLEAGHGRIDIGPLPYVNGDLHMLTQLWQNLINNAIKFRRKGVAPEIRIEALERAADWCFSITDNGIGIDPAHREQIFLVFRRLHTSDEYPGSGIGLAICKKVVQLHGGDIWVEPASGQGTRFAFSLPKKPAAGRLPAR